MSALSLRSVVVRFGERTVLDHATLDVADGDVVALVGPSGSGKSTVLRVVAGVLHPDAGEVWIGGRDVTRVPTLRRGVGMVFQDQQLFPHLDVAGNVAFGLRMNGWERSRARTRIREVLSLVSLDGYERRTVTSLSGGEATRVALARSLAPMPSLLLLDEPLTGLDRELRDALAVELRRILRAAGTTAVLVTHDRGEADTIADRTEAMPLIPEVSAG